MINVIISYLYDTYLLTQVALFYRGPDRVMLPVGAPAFLSTRVVKVNVCVLQRSALLGSGSTM